jgi:hypothetical protein
MFSSFATSDEFESLLQNKRRLKVGFMKMFIQDKSGRKNFGISQSFPAQVEGAYINKRHGFIYRWNRKEVTVTKMLGTNKPKQIEKQISSLLDECKRFLFMYCSSNIELTNW